MCSHALTFTFFFFNDTATTEIYTLSLHDALPILRWTGHRSAISRSRLRCSAESSPRSEISDSISSRDRKSTRLNSSHGYISYAVFCLKKKKKHRNQKCPTLAGVSSHCDARALCAE